MRNYFLKKDKTFDQEFAYLLRKHSPWMNDISDIRDFLVHRFHDLAVDYDFWTRTGFAFLYEFNTKKDFLPDILSYVGRTYFRFVRFLKDYETLFKNKCERQFPSFEYFHGGSPYARTLDKVHLFFVSLGRIVDNRILIRIHPNRRDIVPSKLEGIMREEKGTCKRCGSYRFRIRPTTEQFILISVRCACGDVLPIPFIVEKKFFPYFMDQNRKENLLGLIPYTLSKPN